MTTILKTVKKYGNSGGVYVPSSWIGGKVKVEMIDEPANPRKDVLENVPLEHVISAILYGSYARKEMERGSDIDILLVTDEDAKIFIPSEIKKKYDIQVKSLSELRNVLAHDPVFYKTIRDEAVAIINHNLLDDVRKNAPPAREIEKRLKIIESSLNITKKIIDLDYTHATDLVYPVVMRLREAMILEYLLDDIKYSTHSFRQEILGIGISVKEFSSLISIYRSEKSGRKFSGYEISMGTIIKLISFLESKINYVRKKAREKRN